jgi:putative transposase
MSRLSDAPSVKDVLVADAGVQRINDVLSTVVREALQELRWGEATARFGAGRWDRTECHRSQSPNGSRTRTVSTPAGNIHLGIPEPPKGSSVLDLPTPRFSVDRAQFGVTITAYVTGESTRKVDAFEKVLRSKTGVLKSMV